MKKTLAIKDNRVYRQLYSKARSQALPCVVVYWRKNKLNVNRLGLTSAKKIGTAVQRNRARRVMREAYRLIEPDLETGFDIILVARTKTPHVPMAAVMRDLKIALSKAEIYHSSHPSLSTSEKTDKQGN